MKTINTTLQIYNYNYGKCYAKHEQQRTTVNLKNELKIDAKINHSTY